MRDLQTMGGVGWPIWLGGKIESKSDPDEGGRAGGWLCCERAARMLGTQEKKGNYR